MKRLSQFEDKQIVVLGFGLTGMSLAKFLAAQALTFAINDSRALTTEAEQLISKLPFSKYTFGHWDAALIAQADVLLVSPGVDLATAEIAQAISVDCQVMGDVELFCQLTDSQIIAVTGSNGKSTVVSLLAHIAEQLGINAQLAGNIGVPVLDTLAKPTDFTILELSSFQLETISSMHAVAATVLNISDDHLDRHKNLTSYQAIKHKIYQHTQTVVVNRDDPLTQGVSLTSEQRLCSFGLDKPQNQQFGLAMVAGEQTLVFAKQHLLQPLLATSKIPLTGKHNYANCLAAFALGYAAGWPLVEMAQAITSFTGLAHRCQKVPSVDGITWLNDSKATNVGATIAAINGISATLTTQQQLILIAGGDGKGADFSPLKTVLTQQVAQLILIGKDALQLAEQYDHAIMATTMVDAVHKAKAMAQCGDVVLLSPACASLDMFNNYIDRGQQFIAAIGEHTDV